MSAHALQIVVPMAGRGSRFVAQGYAMPKALIDVGGHPMIELVIANLRPIREHRFVFVIQGEHAREYDLDARLREWAPRCDIVVLDGVTDGAARTVLTTRERLDPAAPLMIANCDQYVDTDIDDYLGASDRPELDGLIMTMWADHPKWSFAELGPDGFVRRVVEKEVISHTATVGVYNFRRAGDFLAGADQMIAQDCRVNGEFYVAPVYNQLIGTGARIGVHDVDGAGRAMHGLGTPEDLADFLCSPVLGSAISRCRLGRTPVG